MSIIMMRKLLRAWEWVQHWYEDDDTGHCLNCGEPWYSPEHYKEAGE